MIERHFFMKMDDKGKEVWIPVWAIGSVRPALNDVYSYVRTMGGVDFTVKAKTAEIVEQIEHFIEENLPGLNMMRRDLGECCGDEE